MSMEGVIIWRQGRRQKRAGLSSVREGERFRAWSYARLFGFA
jgi:hypothetical protein